MIDSQLIQWGIIGPGRIASQVIKDFPYVPGAQALAVASRSLARAQAFASEHGLARAYGSYQEIMNDPDVDAVYISTPHPQHHAIALAAIAAGKAVLVEKTFTATVLVDGIALGVGEGKSKKLAEQQAASEAFDALSAAT